MMRQILVAALSLGLALPAMTAPARADSRDVARIVGGLAALYILKEAIERNRDRNTPVQRSHAPPPVEFHPQRTPRRHDRDRPRHRDVRVLPDQCYDTIRTYRGHVSGYRARCTQNAVARPGLLPPECIAQVRTNRGPRNFYDAQCLRRQGWTSRAARR